jgi:hypothetical protein
MKKHGERLGQGRPGSDLNSREIALSEPVTMVGVFSPSAQLKRTHAVGISGCSTNPLRHDREKQRPINGRAWRLVVFDKQLIYEHAQGTVATND